MHQTTRRLLEKLLAHAETEDAQGKRKAFNLTAERAKTYFKEPDFTVKQQIHSELIELERHSVIKILWDRRAGGERGHVLGLSAKSAEALARALGIVRRKDSLTGAEALFSERRDVPRLRLALEIWRDGRAVRGYGPEDAPLLLRVLEVVEYCQNLKAPVAVRRVSASLLGNSKTIERWSTLIDFFTALTDSEAVSAIDGSSAAIFSRINLIRFAQPILMAGDHRVELVGIGERGLAAPYEGVAPDVLMGLKTKPSYILTVENLTTFHELATARSTKDQGLIIYTSGNFSPSFGLSYSRIAASSGCDQFLHWGDVDWKGIEIMGRLSDLLFETTGLPLRHWRMDQMPIETEYDSVERLEPKAIGRILARCKLHGWADIANAVSKHKSRVEQEAQPLVFPSSE